MAGEALDLLTRIAKETSLRYAMHMIMTAALCCKQRKGAEVEVADVRRVYAMFSDLRRSTQYLIEYNKAFMFNELGGEEGADLFAAARATSYRSLLSLTHARNTTTLFIFCFARAQRRPRRQRGVRAQQQRGAAAWQSREVCGHRATSAIYK